MAAAIVPADAFQLITKAEAKLPPDPIHERGITRGPRIILVSPAPTAGYITSPFRLKIRFQGRNGVVVDTDSIVVTYKSIPPIDLTQRVRPFIHADGFEIDDAVVPSGHFRIHVDAKDQYGRTGALDFTFNVRQ